MLHNPDKTQSVEERLQALENEMRELKKQIKTPKQFFDEELLHAAAEGRVDAIIGLMTIGANISACNEKGETALHLCFANSNQEVAQKTAEFILSKAPDLFSVPAATGMTPIQCAAAAGQLPTLTWLYNYGHLADNHALFDQVYSVAGPETQKFLANKKLIEAAKREKPVDASVSDGDIEAVRDAIKKGADINTKAPNGETPLYAAVYYRYRGVAQVLLDAGADSTILIHRYQETALQLAQARKDSEFVKMLATPFLLSAASQGSAARVEAALKGGAELTGTDQDGKTALHKAVVQGDKATINLLLRKHAEAKIDIRMLDKAGHPPHAYLTDRDTITKKNGEIVSRETYLFEKFGGYKKDVSRHEKEMKQQAHTSTSTEQPVATNVPLSTSSLSFVAGIGQSDAAQQPSVQEPSLGANRTSYLFGSL